MNSEMKNLLIFALILTTFLSVASGSTEQGSRIVGGKNATENQFPYTVSLRVKATNALFCGGAIISNWWVISAAHCTIHRTTLNTVIVAGTLNRLTGGTPYELRWIVNHEKYNGSTLENDICLLKTRTKIEFTRAIQPIQMGTALVGAGVPVILSGWGFTEGRPSTLATYLQWLNTTTISNEECRNIVAGLSPNFPIPDSILCTVSVNGTGPCNADSGGPLTSNGLLVAALSFGFGTCDTGRPNGYPRISYYRPWILNHTGDVF